MLFTRSDQDEVALTVTLMEAKNQSHKSQRALRSKLRKLNIKILKSEKRRLCAEQQGRLPI